MKTYNIIALPPDINSYIAEYLPSYITLSIQIDYSLHYPFSPPVWGLVSCEERLASYLEKAEEYYRYMVAFEMLQCVNRRCYIIMNKNNCVCLICYKPNDIWIDFLSKFTKYDIYIVIDDNSADYKNNILYLVI